MLIDPHLTPQREIALVNVKVLLYQISYVTPVCKGKQEIGKFMTLEKGEHSNSSSTHCSKVISKVKIFKKWVKLQGQGHRVKNNGTPGKVLSQGKLM